MQSDYAKAYVEVLEVLKNIPQEEYNMIPESKIKFFEENKDTSYIYNYDSEKEIEEQTLMRETMAILVGLYRDYIVEENRRSTIDEILKIHEKNYQDALREKYNPDNIFGKK